MAQLIGQETDEDKKKKEEASGPITGPSPITQPQTGSGAPSASTTQQGPAPKGTGFTNLAKVKQANVGGEQKLAGAVTQDVSQAAKTGMSQLGQMYQNYNQQIQAQNLGSNTTGIKALIDKQARGELLTDAEKAQVQRYGTYAYKGPVSLTTQDQGALKAQQDAAKAARDKALASLSATGRTTILGKMGLGQQGLYTPGASRLDEMFLGGRAARGILSQAGSEAEKFASEASGLTGKLSTEDTAAKLASERAQGEVTDYVKQKETDIKSTADARRVLGDTEELRREVEATGLSQNLKGIDKLPTEQREAILNNAVQKGFLSVEDASMIRDLASDPDLVKSSGIDFGSLLKGSYQRGSIGNVEDYYTEDDTKRLAGLASFLGKTSDIKAGSAKKGSFLFDKDILKNALNEGLSQSVRDEVDAENKEKEFRKKAQDYKELWSSSLMTPQTLGEQVATDLSVMAAQNGVNPSGGLQTGFSPAPKNFLGDTESQKQMERWGGAANEQRDKRVSAGTKRAALSKLKSKWGF